MSYAIEYDEQVVSEDIPKLAKAIRQRVKNAIEQKLIENPLKFGKPLRYSLYGARSLRVGDWRVIYRIEPPSTVVVVKIGHRREVYETR